MASTGKEGAKKLQSNCSFYEELDQILGTRDAINPARKTISSSQIIPNKKKSFSVGSVTEQEENSQTALSMSSDSQLPSTSSASHDSPPKSQQEPRKATGKAVKRKRKTPALNDQDDDPYMKGICDMWRLSMEKHTERFNRSMELQQAAIQSQIEQTKALVSGLIDILKD